MHLDRFDLNLLVALDTLLTEKHVSRAAEKLCISQPAMSGALARLRKHLDDPLLERVGTALELTPRGAELVSEVREVITKVRSILRTAPTFDPAHDRRDFRISLTDYAAAVFMPFVTRRLLTEAPYVHLLSENLERTSMVNIGRGVTDCSISHFNREQDHDDDFTGLNHRLLFTDEFVLVLSAGQKPARGRVDLDELLSRPYVEVRFAYTVFSIVDAAIRRQELPFKMAAATPSFVAAACLIPGTPMAAIIPRRLAQKLGPILGLDLYEVPFDLPEIRETLVWHRRSEADPAHAWFRQFIFDVADQL